MLRRCSRSAPCSKPPASRISQSTRARMLCLRISACPSARCIFFLEALDPLLFQQAAQRSVQRAGAEPHPSFAHPLGVLEDGVAVARLFGKAQKDEQDRLADLHISPYDMSYNAIFPDS